MLDQNSRKRPKIYIDKAIEYLKKLGGKIIVEIGSMRIDLKHDPDEINHECCNDGHSSILWARTGLEFYTVDISKDVYNNTKINLEKHKGKNYQIICDDGINFLKNFMYKIDLLFLDAWDVEFPESAQKHLEVYQIAKKNLHENSLILIDDTDINYINGEFFLDESGVSGKGALVIPKCVADGYKIIFCGRQTLLCKKDLS